MSIAYNGSAKLAAPQFKAYKGLRISVKEKMRLNNIVWREWYLQYVKKRKNTRRQKDMQFSTSNGGGAQEAHRGLAGR
ncbi:MLXIPL [Bugula neritina]|uniref:MLXIPL n=1 Tax=Bugula neritina TaxID=10212 RepID=A0A7J7KDR1_BUGNE|nr:MLXIPL [Bugula neritina]